jgi:predicted Zn-ribbon and HTH transcriptional regulator
MHESARTRRQWLLEFLEQGERSFTELCELLEARVRDVEDDLRHVERSLRAEGRRLRVTPARCGDCGFVFRGRERRHLHPPGRCPKCRRERIHPPRFAIAPR